MKDKNLIFLISQPRSGSTMLQQVLQAQPQIQSVPEPWFLLPIVDLFSNRVGTEAPYGDLLAQQAFENFLQHKMDGKKQFQEHIKELALNTYSIVADTEKYDFFLDKTPRYYHIVEELSSLFPQAKFIVLLRNPISVFASILESFYDGSVQELARKESIHDLFTGPKKLVDFAKQNHVHVINYEEIVKNQEVELTKLGRYLGLKNIHASYQTQEAGRQMGDMKSVHKHNKPVVDYLSSWKKSLNTPLKVNLAKQYLQLLGEKTVMDLGYSYADILTQLNALEVKGRHVSVDYQLLCQPLEQLSYLKKAMLLFKLNYEAYGLKGIRNLILKKYRNDK